MKLKNTLDNIRKMKKKLVAEEENKINEIEQIK